MAESVECAECGNRYDSQVDAFCSRCGSTKTGQTFTASVDVAQRGGAVRRRVQAGGVILLVMGLLAMVAYATIAIAPAVVVDNMEVFLTDQQGGEVAVQVLQNGTPVAGTEVRFVHPDGSVLANASTNAQGWANASAASAYLLVEVGDFQQGVVSLPEATTAMEVDLATATGGETVGLDTVVSAVRGVSGFFAVMSLFVVAGGIAAIRVQGRGLALGGAGLGMLPALILFVATPTGGVGLLLLVTGTAFVLIYSGRREF